MSSDATHTVVMNDTDGVIMRNSCKKKDKVDLHFAKSHITY